MRPYAGPVAMFISDELAALPDAPARRWQEAVPQIELHRIAGSHVACVTTDRQLFAENLAACLREPASAV